MSKKTLLLGGQMPSLPGLEQAITDAERLGFTTMQMLMLSNPYWMQHEIATDQVKKFKDARAKSNIKEIVGIDPYFARFGFSDLKHNEIMAESIAHELVLCESLDIPYLIIHPGTCPLNSSSFECFSQMTSNIDVILSKAENLGAKKCMIILQNMASPGKSLFYSFENMARVFNESLYQDRIGFCFDMASAYASGYEFATKDDYEAMWQEISRFIALDKIKVVHINDSQEPAGSEINFHAFIGKGKIPWEAYRLIMNDERFFDIPKIIEIPATSLADYQESMRKLIDLLTPYNKQLFGLK